MGHSIVRIPLPDITYYYARTPNSSDLNQLFLTGGLDGNNQSMWKRGEKKNYGHSPIIRGGDSQVVTTLYLFQYPQLSSLLFKYHTVNAKVFIKDEVFGEWDQHQEDLLPTPLAYQTTCSNHYHAFVS